MRKYLMGMLAVALAIGFSAFTSPRKINRTKETGYYWYVIENGVTTSSSPIDFDLKTIGEVSETGCEDTEGTVCLAGFTELVGENEEAPDPNDPNDNVLFHDTK